MVSDGDKEVLIDTDDKVVRHFLMINPYRIVVDFNKESHFRGNTLITNLKRIPQIALGNHDGFYRLVFYLDGHYTYNLEPTRAGYRLELR